MSVAELHSPTLREWLRTQTRDRHKQVDAVFSALFSGGYRGYARFLTAHAIAGPALASTIHAHSDLPFATQFAPEPLSAFLKRDLEALGFPLPAPATAPAPLSRDAALGAAYTLAGSRLGAKFMDRQWRNSKTDTFESTYLSAEALFGDWQAFCVYLSGISPHQTDFNTVRKGALTAFDCFDAAATLATETIACHD